MANLSNRTRKEQVLDYLQERRGEWVDGPEIANERVGGSEGHRRFRELRDDGWPVEERRHPHPDRDVWQYRIAPREGVAHSFVPGPKGLVRVEREGKPDQYISPSRAAAESYDTARKAVTLDQRRTALATPRIPPGTLRVQWGDRICGTCNGTGGNMIEACLRCGGAGKIA